MRLEFRKRSGWVFTRPAESEFILGWLGINRAVSRTDRTIELNPVIGLRDQRIENLVSQLHAERPHAYVPPTVSSSLGYLMPNAVYRSWRISEESRVSQTITEMVDQVELYGLPFLIRSADASEIVELLAKTTFTPGNEHRSERLIAAYIIAGDRSRAVEQIRALLNALGTRQDPAALRLREFAARAQSAAAES